MSPAPDKVAIYKTLIDRFQRGRREEFGPPPSWYGPRYIQPQGRLYEATSEETGPWYLRWCTPDGYSAGDIELTDVDPKADPMERAAADEICRHQERRHPTFLWWVSNERVPRVIRP